MRLVSLACKLEGEVLPGRPRRRPLARGAGSNRRRPAGPRRTSRSPPSSASCPLPAGDVQCYSAPAHAWPGATDTEPTAGWLPASASASAFGVAGFTKQLKISRIRSGRRDLKRRTGKTAATCARRGKIPGESASPAATRCTAKQRQITVSWLLGGNQGSGRFGRWGADAEPFSEGLGRASRHPDASLRLVAPILVAPSRRRAPRRRAMETPASGRTRRPRRPPPRATRPVFASIPRGSRSLPPRALNASAVSDPAGPRPVAKTPRTGPRRRQKTTSRKPSLGEPAAMNKDRLSDADGITVLSNCARRGHRVRRSPPQRHEHPKRHGRQASTGDEAAVTRSVLGARLIPRTWTRTPRRRGSVLRKSRKPSNR